MWGRFQGSGHEMYGGFSGYGALMVNGQGMEQAMPATGISSMMQQQQQHHHGHHQPYNDTYHQGYMQQNMQVGVEPEAGSWCVLGRA